jgi:hypothetical protein
LGKDLKPNKPHLAKDYPEDFISEIVAWECDECGETFDDKSDAINHVKAEHGDVDW